jgi:hypothetical protein
MQTHQGRGAHYAPAGDHFIGNPLFAKAGQGCRRERLRGKTVSNNDLLQIASTLIK